MARKKNNYITNDEIMPVVSQYCRQYRTAKETGEPPPRFPEELGRIVLLIARNVAKKGNFSGYSFKEDMIGDGCEVCIRYLHNFNSEKSKNAFSYITITLWRAFVRRIQIESGEAYIRHKLILERSDFFDQLVNEDPNILKIVDLEKSGLVVESFEGSKRKAKERSKASASKK